MCSGKRWKHNGHGCGIDLRASVLLESNRMTYLLTSCSSLVVPKSDNKLVGSDRAPRYWNDSASLQQLPGESHSTVFVFAVPSKFSIRTVLVNS
jgi:hypothetical protein